ncbi:MAG TPA: hypothetical protein VMJ10_14160 [Kofleriaceae bacterium]|nr:hypothetical protein [Kofleriaceae bacterium]
MTSCPRDLPASCPDPAPSYMNDVAPLIEEYCQTAACHSPTGSGVGMLSPYSNLYGLRVDAEGEIYSCKMPYAPPDLTDDERVTLLTWFVCGAPNN